MAKKAGPERGSFPERFEVPVFHFLRQFLKWAVRKTLDGMKRAWPDLYLAAAWIYTQETAENMKRWTEGTILAGGLLVENVADILPVPSWLRKVIESLASDVPLNITEYFTLRKAQGAIVFPDGYVGPRGEDIKKSLDEFAAKFREGLRDRVRRMAPWLNRWKEAWDRLIARFKGDDGFRQHSFKAFRASFLDMDETDRELLVAAFWGPPKPDDDQPLPDQGLWNFLESHEYAGTPEQLAKVAKLSRRHLRFWLAMQDHDDWINFMSPNLKAKVKEVLAFIDQGAGQLADDLEAWADRKARQREESRWKWPRVKLNKTVVIGLILAGLVLVVYLTLLPKHPLWAVWIAVMTTFSALALGVVVLISRHVALESIRREEKTNG